MKKINLVKWFLILFLILPVGCDDSTSEPFSFSFNSDNSTTYDNSVTLGLGDVTDDVIIIDVKANEITNGGVYCVYFDLSYENYYLRFAGFEQGDFLEQGGSVNYQVGLDSSDSDVLVCAASLVGQSETVTGSGTILSLKFEPLRTGITRFKFDNYQMLGIEYTGGSVITGISWYGATLQVSK